MLQLLTVSNADTDLNKDQNVTLLCSRQITDHMISISVTFTHLLITCVSLEALVTFSNIKLAS